MHIIKGKEGTCKRNIYTDIETISATYSSKGDEVLYNNLNQKFPINDKGLFMPVAPFNTNACPAIEITFQCVTPEKWYFGEEFFKACLGYPSNSFDKNGLENSFPILWQKV